MGQGLAIGMGLPIILFLIRVHAEPCDDSIVELGKSSALVLTGPTTSGKTDFALFLANRYPTHAINSDRMYFFREYNVGTGQHEVQLPPERKHLYQILDPRADFLPPNRFLELVREELAKIHQTGELPLIEGMSTLYTPALVKAHSDDFLYVGLRISASEKRRERIRRRIESFLDTDLVKETESLLKQGLENTPAFQIAATYPLVTLYIRGKISRDTCIDQLVLKFEQIADIQYRVLPGFPQIHWLKSPAGAHEALHDELKLLAENFLRERHRK